MPIDFVEERGGMLPRIGMLHKGEPKPASGAGKNLPNFRFSSPYPDVEAAFIEAYGAEPTELEAILIDANPWEYSMKFRTAGGLQRTCTGSVMTILKDGSWMTGQQCFCKANPNLAKKDTCRPSGSLRVFLPKLGRGGHVLMLAGGWGDIFEITGCLKAIPGAANNLAGVPVVLRRVLRDVAYTEGGKRVTRKQWSIHIEVHPSYMAKMLEAWDSPYQLTAGAAEADTGWEDSDDAEYGFVVDPETGEIIDATPEPATSQPEPVKAATAVTEPAASKPEPATKRATKATKPATAEPATSQGQPYDPQDDPNWARFHALMTDLYAKAANDWRPEIVKFVTKGKKTSSKELTETELHQAVVELSAKLHRINNGTEQAIADDYLIGHLVKLAKGQMDAEECEQYIDLLNSGDPMKIDPIAAIRAFFLVLDDDVNGAMEMYEKEVKKNRDTAYPEDENIPF